MIKKEKYVYLIYILIGIFALRDLLFVAGSIQLYVDPGIPPFAHQVNEFMTEKFYVWSGNALGYRLLYPTEIYYDVIVGSLSYLGIDGMMISKIVVLFSIIFSGISMYILCRYYFSFRLPNSFISGLFYMITPVMFNEIIASHLLYIVSYSISPLVFFIILKSINSKINWIYLLIGSILFSFSGIQLQFLIMNYVLISLFILFVVKSEFINKLKVLLIIPIVTILLNLYWIIPFIFDNTSSAIFGKFSITTFETMSTPITDTILLHRYAFPFFRDAIDKLNPLWNFLGMSLILLIFYTGYVGISKKNKIITFFTLLSICTIILISGLKIPIFNYALGYFFLNFKLSIMFRELYTLTYIIAFSYSILLAYSIDMLFFRSGPNTKKIYIVVFILIISYGSPMLIGNLGGLKPYDFNEYKNLYDRFNFEKDELQRVLLIPMTSVVQYEDSWNYWGRDMLLIYFPMQTLDLHENEEKSAQLNTINIYNSLYNGQLNKNLMNMTGIKYIVVRNNITGILSLDTKKLSKFLNSSADLRLVGTYGNYSQSIYEYDKPKPIIYTANNIQIAYDDISKLSDYDVYAISPEETNINIPYTSLIVSDPYEPLFINSFVPKEYKTDILNYASSSSEFDKDWINYLKAWWINPSLAKYFGNIVFTSSNKSMVIPFISENTSDYILNILYYYSIDNKNMPSFDIMLDNNTIIEKNLSNINLNYISSINMTLENVTKGKHIINITNGDGMLYLLDVSIIPKEIYEESKNRSDLFKKRYNIDFSKYTNKTELGINFTHKKENDPGTIAYINSTVYFNLTIDKDRDNTDISFDYVDFPLNWSGYDSLSFMFRSSGTCKLSFIIHDKKNGNIVQIADLCEMVPLNNYKEIIIPIPKGKSDNIDAVYFQTSDDNDIFTDKQNMNIQISNINLIKNYYNSSLYINNTDLINPEIKSYKIDPTSYRVTINNSVTPYYLVFSESYDNGWKLSTNGSELPETYHFIANGFSNGWYVDKTGNYTINVGYAPQRLYFLGLKTSFIILALLAIIILILKIKPRVV